MMKLKVEMGSLPPDESGVPPLIVIPGTRLARQNDLLVGGSGTYTHEGIIAAAVLGVVTIVQTDDIDESSSRKIRRVTVRTNSVLSVVPSLGDIVTCRIFQTGKRFAKCSIVAVGETPLVRPFLGMLRKEDVRAIKKDSVVLSNAVRCGDVIIGRVISMGDSQSYLISTAEEELGVVLAYSESRVPMVPLTWSEMQCPKTGQRESRKVAKVVPADFLDPVKESGPESIQVN